MPARAVVSSVPSMSQRRTVVMPAALGLRARPPPAVPGWPIELVGHQCLGVLSAHRQHVQPELADHDGPRARGQRCGSQHLSLAERDVVVIEGKDLPALA